MLDNFFYTFYCTKIIVLFTIKGSFKRKADVIELSNINRQCSNTVAFNFASSTPTLVTANKQPVSTSSKFEIVIYNCSIQPKTIYFLINYTQVYYVCIQYYSKKYNW